MSRPQVVALSGGIGGAKLALGLYRILPPDTSGGFPDDYFYASGYNAAVGSAGLAGTESSARSWCC